MNRKKTYVTIGILIVVGLLLGIMLVQGVKIHKDNSGIKISGGIFYSADISYSEIQEVQMVTSISFGDRTNGAALNSYKFGNYENSAYGSYKLFVNTDIPKFIVISYGNHKTVVFNCKNDQDTEQMYEELLNLVAQCEKAD